jgi:hypothetical protein
MRSRRTGVIMVEMLSEPWRRIVLLCVPVAVVVAVLLAIANKVRHRRRTAARLLRESDARDEKRLGDRLSRLTAQTHVAKDETDEDTAEENTKR